mgnify:CR=1 FL=1
MKFLKKIKKILLASFLFVSTFVIAGCSKANFNFKKDGSGTVALSISKNYVDEETGENLVYTIDDVNNIVDKIIKSSEISSGQEDRVKLKSIKENDEGFNVTLKFMRIQYLSRTAASAIGDLGIYTYKNSADFIEELDSVSILRDSWTYGSYNDMTKSETSTIYKFNNKVNGNPDAAFFPIVRETGHEMSIDETDEFFGENSELATNKKGKMFTFFMCDIKGLEEVTFNFKGIIDVYGSKNVKEITKSSITVEPIIQTAKLIDADGNITTKDCKCFVGYVYFTTTPSILLFICIGIFGAALVGLIAFGIIKGWFRKAHESRTMQEVRKNRSLYFMLIPAFILLFLFSYIPMAGIVVAFKNYRLTDGIWKSEWASMGGFRNFYDLFNSPTSEFWLLAKNTFLLALWKFIFGFLIAIVLAVLYSYLREGLFKKTVQSISYFPYFISWVVISTISYVFLATDGGVINQIVVAFGGKPINFYASPQYWPFILTFTAMWKTAGYSTIIYLAAIVSIDPCLYEAAKLDGAGRFRQLWHITLPGLAPVIGIQIVFSLGNLVKDDFDQIYTMIRGSGQLRATTDTIGKIVFENISNASNYSGVAAMGLLQGVIGLILVVAANNFLKKRGIQGAY